MDHFVAYNKSLKQTEAPASKSFAQRALFAAALCKTETHVKHIGHCDDVLNCLEIIKQLGATVKTTKNGVIVKGFVNPIKSLLNAGESGLGIRISTSLAAAIPGNFELTGEGSLQNRPMLDFNEILPQLGVDFSLKNGHLPISIRNNAKPGHLKINGSSSSQYLSGLLMALPLLKGESTIEVKALKSKPYIDITLSVLNEFGISITHEKYERFHIAANLSYTAPFEIEIEGDYSGASVLMVHGALSNGIVIKGLNPKSVQGDKLMLDALSNAGVNYNWNGANLEVEKSAVNPFEFDATECPDLFPALVVLAAGATGKSILTGVQRLIHKESNRALVLKNEFEKLGLKIDLLDDTMFIHGVGKLNSGSMDSNNDHRIAMAGAASACLTAKGVLILNAESVSKSYPNFWDFF